MATPKQLTALEKWLKAPLKEMEFKTADNALTRLHAASEIYNKNPKKEKGIVKKTKENILAEFKALHLLNEESEEEQEDKQLETFANGLDIQRKEKEKENTKGMLGPGDVDYDKEGFIIEKGEEETKDISEPEKAIILEVAIKLEACAPYASGIVERKFERYGLSNEQKAELTEKVMMYIAINATKAGL